jgi:methionine-rich copper-binding protein CopC
MRQYRHLLFLLAPMASILLLMTVAVGSACAHATVIKATPGIGSTVGTAPSTVTVETEQNMNPDPKLSNLFVYGPKGELISQGDAKVSLNNPREMSVPIKAEGDGIYIVRWITTSAEDNEGDQGAFTFTVRAGAAATTVTATPQTNTGHTEKKEHEETTTAAATGFPVLPVTITGIIALLVGLAAGFGLARATRKAG